ncbi:ricin-type beta-trefoil lectin domain protein [Lentzea sp. NPDC051838]|uniref:ricin-type beta-trefoil lectin domain protein n=1 Tax=Lentzea sp. NPDC051838 TaxID=3154849 RepID=UPI00344641CC
MTKIAVVVAGVVAAGLLSAGASQAMSGGTVVPNGSHQFLARVTSGSAACSAALIDAEWIVTSSSCLPSSGEVKVVVGDVNLGTGAGHATKAVEVKRHPARDLAVARLEVPAPVAPIALGTDLAANESVKAAGFGRTDREWVPDRPRVTAFTAATAGSDAVLTGGADLCRGDAGGPVFRERDGVAELVGISRTSWQNGCLLVDETRKGSTATRTDDVVTWLRQQFAGQRIRNFNGLCADIESNAPGTVVGLFTCDPGHHKSQKWQVPGDGTIRNYNGLCLDIPSNADGTKIVLANCKAAPGWISQQWKFQDGTIRNSNGLCLDIGSNAPGTPIVITACRPAPGWTSQQWTVRV